MNFKTARLSLPVLLAALSVFLAVPMGSAGCGWLGQPGSAQAGALDCAKDSVKSKIGPVIGEIIKISQSGGDGWEGALGSIGLKLGEDVLGCAVQAALAQMATSRGTLVPSDGGADAAGSRSLDIVRKVDDAAQKRLADYSAKRGFVYKTVP